MRMRNQSNETSSMLKLECVNCGAPIDIGPELSVFACGFCGTKQRVERKGGTVSLLKVEEAIRAVQRGTDRTAAELAIPRLSKELAELDAEMKAALTAAEKRRIAAESGRRILSLTSFFVLLLVGPLLIATVRNSSAATLTVTVLWLASLVALPVFLYRQAKRAPDLSTSIRAHFQPRFERIKAHMDANRAILDKLPE